MSSGNLPRTAHPDLFRWSQALDLRDYLRARYLVSSVHDGEATAIGMAMEQSAATTEIAGYVSPSSLTSWTIRVLDVQEQAPRAASEVGCYQLSTEVYAEGGGQLRDWQIDLAIPLCLLHGKPAQLFNVVVGELPRLGFITRFRLEQCDLPEGFGPGPGFGVAGIRERLRRPRGPILCRSMRPAVGLATADMARLNADVLAGGFHMVKDDELQAFADLPAYRRHLEQMIAARDRARDRSGELKAYLANLICEPDELPARWELCCRLGVDAVLLAPSIQGFGTLSMLARQRQLPILAHNTYGDLLSRHPSWGLAQRVLVDWQAALGADWFVTEGALGDDQTRLPAWPAGSLGARPMPIIQGGKRPERLPAYRAAIGSDDYMLIVASWVDSHPAGLAQAAALFRAAIDTQSDA